MRLSSKKIKRETELELSATSMIDIVFLLLIFFLVTSSFVKAEREYRPSIKVNEKSSSANSDLEKAIVEIVEKDGEFMFQIGSLQTTSDEELVRVLKTFGNKDQGAFIRAPDTAPFDLSARAFAACKEAGFDKKTYVPFDN